MLIYEAVIHKTCTMRNAVCCLCLQKAKKKPIDKKTPADLGVEIKPLLQVVSVEEPATRQAGVKVDSVETLVNALRQKGVLPV